MKKNLKTLYFLFLATFAFSCGGGGVLPNSNAACESRVKEYEIAFTAFAGDPSNKSKCEAAKNAIEKVISGCTLYTAVQRKTYQDQIDQWKCN